MKNILPLLLLLMTVIRPGISNAQQNTFSKVIDYSPGGITVFDISQAWDDGFLIAGNVENNNVVIKMDTSGNPQWIKGYNFSQYGNSLRALTQTYDSNYVTVGTISDPLNSIQQTVCMKLNENGEVLWSKMLSGGNKSFAALKVIQTADSTLFVTGTVSINYTTPIGIFAAYLDQEGNLLWSREYACVDRSLYPASAKQTADGGILITGHDYRSYSLPMGAFLLKLDYSGLISWFNHYAVTPEKNSFGVDVVLSGDQILLITNHGVTKVDNTGSVVWSKLYHNLYSQYIFDSPTPKVKVLTNGDFILLMGDVFLVSYLLHFDSAGNLIAERGLALGPASITETKNKEIIIAGNGPLIGVKTGSRSDPQIGIIQTDSVLSVGDCIGETYIFPVKDTMVASPIIGTTAEAGILSDVTPIISHLNLTVRNGCVDFIGSVAELPKQPEIQIYPNPVKSILTVESKQVREEAEISLYDARMQLVLQHPMKQTIEAFNVSHLPAGIYFLKVASGRVSGVVKVIIE
jgi:hypothetical protein